MKKRFVLKVQLLSILINMLMIIKWSKTNKKDIDITTSVIITVIPIEVLHYNALDIN